MGGFNDIYRLICLHCGDFQLVTLKDLVLVSDSQCLAGVVSWTPLRNVKPRRAQTMELHLNYLFGRLG